jgi:hypothetical protein
MTASFVSRSRKRKPSRGVTSRIRTRVMVAQPHSRDGMSLNTTPARAIRQFSLNSCRCRTAHSRTRARARRGNSPRYSSSDSISIKASEPAYSAWKCAGMWSL